MIFNYNIKLIYISSMQVYSDYGKNHISTNSKINKKNLYSISHYKSEKIIIKKFLKHKKMFTILRMGNVFGFRKYNHPKEIDDNLLHSLCDTALKKKKILIKNGSIQRTFIPSKIFVNLINTIIRENFFFNSLYNISYKTLNLKEIAEIIKKRLSLIFNIQIDIIVREFYLKKNFLIRANNKLKFSVSNQKINLEIDQILKILKKLI